MYFVFYSSKCLARVDRLLSLRQAGANKAWYLFSDPAVAAVFEVSDLEGYPGPRVESQDFFHTLGTEFRVVWHVGDGPVDSRGAWKNPGV